MSNAFSMATPPPSDMDARPEPQDSAHLPPMVPVGTTLAPQAPASVETAGVDGTLLADLALKLAYTVPPFTSDWAARRLRLPFPLLHDLLEQANIPRLSLFYCH